MSRAITRIQSESQTEPAKFSVPAFQRLLRMLWLFRGKFILGLVCIVVYAALHTVSIGAAFPIFKLILEKEGLQGWVDRTVASHRLGAELPPVGAAASERLLDVSREGPVAELGAQRLDMLSDADGRPLADVLREIAHAPEGAAARITLKPAEENVGSPTGTYTVALRDTDWKHEAMLRAAGLMPAAATDAEAKIAALKAILIGLVLVVIATNVFRYLGEVLLSATVLHAMLLLREQLYDRALQLPMTWYAAERSSDVVSRFVTDIQEIQRGLIAFVGKFLREPIAAAFLLVAAFFVDWRITLVLLIVGPLAVGAFYLIGRKVKKFNRRLLEGFGMMIDALTTSLQNIRTVKAYTAEAQEAMRLDYVDRSMFRQQLRLAKLQAVTTPMMETVAVIGGSILTVWFAGRVIGGELSLAKFLTLGAMLSMMFDPIRKLSDVYVRVMRSTAGAERIFQIIDAPIERDFSSGHDPVGPLREAITFESVSFTYPKAEAPALIDVNLTIRKGETVALVGPNGCGKTTLVSLLLRFFDPPKGSVRYDGLELRQADLQQLRRQISLVSQEAVVFGGTPLQNIAYGDEQPDEARARDAARRARATDFIENIPGGFAAALGERGTTLSGGQRQRLAIARAIYRNAPVLIFDEATSQIDTESERHIQAALREFAQGRTTIVIAHRLSTIQFADRIVVMDAGRIIDAGSHAELLKRCTFYRNLCETQLLGEDRSERAAARPEGAVVQ
jgi:ABC-type multidrug transport system fused ATPase/permease subunit